MSQVAEERLETLQVHCVELEREVRELQTEMREARQQLKEAESQRNGSREAEFSSIRQQVRRFENTENSFLRGDGEMRVLPVCTAFCGHDKYPDILWYLMNHDCGAHPLVGLR